MDTRQMRYFLTVVDEGSFSRAADVLHISQPPLSVAVKRLEKQLGVVLLVRNSSGVTPTEAGRYLARAARRLLREIAETEHTLRGMGQGLEGQLRLAVVPSFSWAHLPPLVTAFAEQAPDVELILSDPPPEEVIGRTLDGRVDIGIVACGDTDRLRSYYSDDLHVVRIGLLPLVAALPPRLAGDGPVDIYELASERWLLPTRSPRFPGLPELIEQIWSELDFRPHAVREVSTLQTAIPLVAAGIGITLLPSSMRRITQDTVVTRELQQHVPPLQATVLWRADTENAPLVQRFLDLAVANRAE